MGAAYSSLGRTKVLYATSLVLLGAKANGQSDRQTRYVKNNMPPDPYESTMLKLQKVSKLISKIICTSSNRVGVALTRYISICFGRRQTHRVNQHVSRPVGGLGGIKSTKLKLQKSIKIISKI